MVRLPGRGKDGKGRRGGEEYDYDDIIDSLGGLNSLKISQWGGSGNFDFQGG